MPDREEVETYSTYQLSGRAERVASGSCSIRTRKRAPTRFQPQAWPRKRHPVQTIYPARRVATTGKTPDCAGCSFRRPWRRESEQPLKRGVCSEMQVPPDCFPQGAAAIAGSARRLMFHRANPQCPLPSTLESLPRPLAAYVAGCAYSRGWCNGTEGATATGTSRRRVDGAKRRPHKCRASGASWWISWDRRTCPVDAALHG